MFFASTALWVLLETTQARVVERFPTKEACSEMKQEIDRNNVYRQGYVPVLVCRQYVVMK